MLKALTAGAPTDVVGPVSSTDRAVARFNGTTGKIIQNSGVIIDDSNNVTGVAALTASGQVTLTGAALIQKNYAANSGATITIDPLNGKNQEITLTASTTITMPTSLAAGLTQQIDMKLIQDNTGSRTVAWVNVTWDNGVAPTVATAIGAITAVSFINSPLGVRGFYSPTAASNLTVGQLTVNAGLLLTTRVVIAAGAVTVTSADIIVIVNKTSGAATVVNLPAGVLNTVFIIKDGKGDAASNNITLTPAAGNIDGAATYVMNTNYGSTTIVYNGTTWSII